MQEIAGDKSLTAKVMAMLKQYLFLLFVLFSLGALVAPGLAQNAAAKGPETNPKLDTKYESWKALQATERYSGPMALTSTKGTPIPVQVNLRVWSIDAGRGPQNLMVHEFTIFHLRAGTLKTVVDGKEQVRKPDDFWALPAGSQMTVQVKGEAAVLETTSVSSK